MSFSSASGGTLAKNAATGKWNETHRISFSDVTRTGTRGLVIAGVYHV
jgi:hypothetical protein